MRLHDYFQAKYLARINFSVVRAPEVSELTPASTKYVSWARSNPEIDAPMIHHMVANLLRQIGCKSGSKVDAQKRALAFLGFDLESHVALKREAAKQARSVLLEQTKAIIMVSGETTRRTAKEVKKSAKKKARKQIASGIFVPARTASTSKIFRPATAKVAWPSWAPPDTPNPSSDDFLGSYAWRRVRMEALKLHGAQCQCCGASPATGAVMNVDHIKPRKLYPELALAVSNLQVLCHECNHGKGNWDATDWRPKSVSVASEHTQALEIKGVPGTSLFDLARELDYQAREHMRSMT